MGPKKSAPLAVWNKEVETTPTNNELTSDIVVQIPPADVISNSSSGLGRSKASTETMPYSPDISSFDDDPKFYEISNTSIWVNENNNKNGYISNQYEGVKFNDSICSSGSSCDDDDEVEVKRLTAPDGGWGWIIVVSSFLISMVADGISFSFGLLYIEFLNHFGESKSTTSWIGSLFMAVPLLSGPIMSALVDRFGCKWMTILGGVISGTGFVVASFGNTIEWEFVWFGVVAGLGLGLCYVTAVVSVAYWFDKKRTLATGLGACGTGFGTTVYAPMTQFFITEYGWRGCVLLLAGTFFNMCVCGSLMRDPPWIIEEHSKQASLTGTKSVRNASSIGSISGGVNGGDNESQFPGVDEIRKLMKSGQPPEYILTTLAASIPKQEQQQQPEGTKTTTYRSALNLPTYLRQSETVPLEVLEQLSSNKRVYKIILESYPSLLLFRSNSVQCKLNDAQAAANNRPPVTMSMKLKTPKKQTSPPLEPLEPCMIPLLSNTEKSAVIVKTPRKIFSSPMSPKDYPWNRHQYSLRDHGAPHYLKDIRVHRNSVMYRGATLHLPRYRLRASSCPNIYRNSMTTIAKENEEKWYEDALELCKGMFDFSMFLELHFCLMSLATILLFIWFIVPYFYLTEHMTRHQFSEEDGSRILSWIGVMNTIGMVTLGWAGDQPWMNVTKTYSVCLILCGVSAMLMPLTSDNYWLLFITCGCFGVFFASNYSFTPTILVELIPLERFTTAYGLILLCQGIGNLTGPPLAGWLFDMTGSWDLSFYMAGVWIIVAGLLVAIIPATKNKKIWGSGLLEMDRASNV